MQNNRNKVFINGNLDKDTKEAFSEFAQNYNYTDIGKRLSKWLEKEDSERDEFVIDTDLCQLDYEAVLDFIENNPNLEITKELIDWKEYTAYDFAAYYIGDES